MKRILLTATVLVLASAGAAFAASPDAVKAVADCCAQMAAACGMPCCP
jgi:2-keto-3-deoxy-6-phosphogluconate aldolase